MPARLIYPSIRVYAVRIRSLLAELSQHLYNVVAVGESSWSVFLAELNHAIFVHQDDGALSYSPLGVPKIIGLCRLTFGVPVGELRVREPTQGRTPCSMCRYVVTAYAQNLGIIFLDPGVVLPEEDGLIGSTAGKVENMEGEHHVLLAAVLAEGYVPLVHGGKGKIRSRISYLCGHMSTSL